MKTLKTYNQLFEHKFDINVDSEIQLFADRLEKECENNEFKLYHHHIYDDDDFIVFEIVDKHYNNIFNFRIKRFDKIDMLDFIFEKLLNNELSKKTLDVFEPFLKKYYNTEYEKYIKYKKANEFNL